VVAQEVIDKVKKPTKMKEEECLII
jgi:hypothetical protein